jgi:X-X-X-Leu-X-X-Gly heptad repeat protein
LPFFCSFIAAILAFRSSLLLAISNSFSSLVILAKLGVTEADGGVGALLGGSSTSSSHPSDTGAVGMTGLEEGFGEGVGVDLTGGATDLTDGVTDLTDGATDLTDGATDVTGAAAGLVEPLVVGLT